MAKRKRVPPATLLRLHCENSPSEKAKTPFRGITGADLVCTGCKVSTRKSHPVWWYGDRVVIFKHQPYHKASRTATTWTKYCGAYRPSEEWVRRVAPDGKGLSQHTIGYSHFQQIVMKEARKTALLEKQKRGEVGFSCEERPTVLNHYQVRQRRQSQNRQLSEMNETLTATSIAEEQEVNMKPKRRKSGSESSDIPGIGIGIRMVQPAPIVSNPNPLVSRQLDFIVDEEDCRRIALHLTQRRDLPGPQIRECFRRVPSVSSKEQAQIICQRLRLLLTYEDT